MQHQMGLAGRNANWRFVMITHFLDIESQSKETIIQLIKKSFEMKQNKYVSNDLEYKTVGLIFEKPSLRTRVSFEVGIKHLGGYPLILHKEEIGLGKREAIKDVARVLSRLVDMVMIRTFEHEKLVEFSNHSTIPVINGLTDNSHPCQALADMLTIYETFGKLKGLKVVYLGDDNNVSSSLAEVCAKTQMECVISSPTILQRENPVMRFEKDPQIAIEQADVIYTDTWVSMGDTSSKEKIQSLQAYQLNRELLSKAKSTAIVMHCLPAHRGQEITDEVIESNRSVVFQQAENRIHAQKAIMHYLTTVNQVAHPHVLNNVGKMEMKDVVEKRG